MFFLMQSLSDYSLNGDEPMWKDYERGYGEHKQGSNCYSFAMGDFRRNGVRPHKSVPGNLVTHVQQRHKALNIPPKYLPLYKDVLTFQETPGHRWNTCNESVRRLLMDGRAAALIHQLDMVSPSPEDSRSRRVQSIKSS